MASRETKMTLQTDPTVVAKLAREREAANWRFRTFLKGLDLDIEEIDAIVYRHYKEVAARIDCSACGNCCRKILPELDASDMSRLSSSQGMSADEFATQFLARNEEGDLTFNALPCPFLEGNRCRVYAHRPDTCRSYPHLDKEGFVFHLAQTVSNCAVCLIVFNVMERLKAELGHGSDDRKREAWT